jgi:hypothetical protein
VGHGVQDKKGNDYVVGIVAGRRSADIMTGSAAQLLVCVGALKELAESHLTRGLFGTMLRRIWALPVPAGSRATADGGTVAKKRSKGGGCRDAPRESDRPSSNPCRQVAAEIDQATRDLTEWAEQSDCVVAPRPSQASAR